MLNTRAARTDRSPHQPARSPRRVQGWMTGTTCRIRMKGSAYQVSYLSKEQSGSRDAFRSLAASAAGKALDFMTLFRWCNGNRASPSTSTCFDVNRMKICNRLTLNTSPCAFILPASETPNCREQYRLENRMFRSIIPERSAVCLKQSVNALANFELLVLSLFHYSIK